VEPGKTGHLIIRKPWPGMLMNIYGDPHRYEAAYWSRFPGAYHTGDFAMRDEDGYMWMLGRADEVLKVAGHRIGTAEIETAAVGHPAVAEAAVTGKPDDVKGESIVLFATLREGIDPSKDLEKEIGKYIRQAIGPVATPDMIYFSPSLPRTRSGKLMRRVLRAIASGQRVGDLTTVENEASIEEIKKAFETVLGSSEADGVRVGSRA
ncbi:MAG: AMP-binding protein, partial [Dehalococcoidia bacterium]